MTDAPRLDIQACHRLMADGKRSGTGDLSPELADQLKAALVLLSEAREALDDVLTQIENCDGTAQLYVDDAQATLSRIPDLGELTR